MELKSPQGGQYLKSEYVAKRRSTHSIAEELGVYPGLVRKALIYHGIALRSRSEAQKAALEEGSHPHPTKGRERTEEEKEKISAKMAQQWDAISEEERLRRSEQSRQIWEALSPEYRQQMGRSANEGLRRSAREGSKMERHIVQSLFEYGYVPSQHREFLFGNDAMHADIFLSPTHPLNRGVVVEIDGPTHFKPIWGEGKLAERIAADRKKTGLALSQGFRMVRLQQKSRHLSRRVLDEAVRLVLGALCGPVEEVILEV